MPIPVSKIGVLALAEPDHGGVFQYTQAVIDALVSVAPGKVVVLSPSPPL